MVVREPQNTLVPPYDIIGTRRLSITQSRLSMSVLSRVSAFITAPCDDACESAGVGPSVG